MTWSLGERIFEPTGCPEKKWLGSFPAASSTALGGQLIFNDFDDPHDTTRHARAFGMAFVSGLTLGLTVEWFREFACLQVV